MKVDVLFARFPYGASEHPRVTDWLTDSVVKAKADPRIGHVYSTFYDDTPITMTRNKCLREARDRGVDLVVMIDSDMHPDNLVGIEPDAVPFWQSSFDHWWQNYRSEPCCIFAPYAGPPPHEVPYIFQLTTLQSAHPNVDWRIQMFSREEAAHRTGFEKVMAGPTGLILIDTRVTDILPKPWFDYEWAGDGPQCPHCHQPKPGFREEKGSTEDVYFTRNCALLGIPQIVNWNAWAGHVKRKTVSKPVLMTVEQVAENMREALVKQRSGRERVVIVDRPLPRMVIPNETNGEQVCAAAK